MTMSRLLHYTSVPDDENGSGGFVVGGSKYHSNFSGLQGLQQQTQHTFSCFLLILTFLLAHTGIRERLKRKHYVQVLSTATMKVLSNNS